MELHSSVFTQGSEIPQRCTCEGEDVAPPLKWKGLPPGTSSLALIVDDPDAPDPAKPQRTWVHWVVVDIPPGADGLPGEGQGLPEGCREGLNDWKRAAWGGPCPPIGRHRYFFKLYALDCKLAQLAQPTKVELEKAMQGHVLAQAELMGTYQKQPGD
jgi:Raf kinase inhibitor-like YbhB/YbcL family protein